MPEASHRIPVCTLAMIPLVKVRVNLAEVYLGLTIILFQMHDLATQDLALRIGGSKTGLLNASLVS
jgi:hypothetical protein